MDFKQVDKKYRPIPFWSWNENLDCDETRRQVRLMNDAGIGGYFMHARGGLLTEYMGKEWFDNVHAACDEGARLGMHSWAYDENGWPSGFGGGKVTALGFEYWQKHLHAAPSSTPAKDGEYTVMEKDGYRYYFEVNEYYVDVLDAKVTDKFIELVYAEYERECGNSFDGFFTDEPQISRFSGYPWSLTLEEQFAARYGYSLVSNLDRLFIDMEGSDRVRLDYWQLVTDLFSENFFKRIYDWCVACGYGFTGHLVLEESLYCQIVSNGACMPHYEYFTIPGMDWLGRPIFECLTPMQVSSAAAQTGKKQILSETFALAGHNVSHGELKRILEWQMVHGITLLCTHLEGYSLRGIRKRDYPPAMYYQQPWWEDMNIFFDAMSRVGMLLTEGRVNVDTLLLHPQSTAWRLFNGNDLGTSCVDRIMDYNDRLLATMRALENKHIEYHLGDETLIRRHGRVEGGKFIIGEMSYSTLVIPDSLGFLPFTEELIAEFRTQGGTILTVDDLPPSPVCAENRLTYTSRSFDGYTLHYFVNTDNSPLTADITVGNKQMLIESGELIPFAGTYTFAPYESLLLIDDGEGRVECAKPALGSRLPLTGEWTVKSATYNSLTLDKCDYYFDGELIAERDYVLNILPRINALRRPVDLEQVYYFECEEVPACVYLATETPEIFEIELNGTRVEKIDCGSFRDASFRLIDIAKNVNKGLNILRFRSTIVQQPEWYDHLSKSWTFEGMKNCLSYNMEVEPIYIVGDFGVGLIDEPVDLPLEAYRVPRQPIITARPTAVDSGALHLSGFPQFAGRLVLEREIDVTDTNMYAHLAGLGMNSVSIAINGVPVAKRLYPPYDVDLSGHLRAGKNTVEITILNNLRNMMGPHHWKSGENLSVGPYSFFKESNIFHHLPGADESCHDPILKYWDEGYCMVKFGFTED